MSILNLTLQTFKQSISIAGIVLVDFWDPQSQPSKTFDPIFEKVSQVHPEVIFAKVDILTEPKLAEHHHIRSTPTLGIYRDGVMILSQPGVMPASVLESVITEAKELDMENIRSLVAKAQGQN